MNTKEFRAELKKIMPGYKWAVKRPLDKECTWLEWLEATGIQSAGFNRMSTLEIIRRTATQRDGSATINYDAKLFGSGMRGPARASAKNITLARTLRGLQECCEAMRAEYTACARALEIGRDKKEGTETT